MENLIRKISVGQGYPDNAMHYMCGKIIKANLKTLQISLIQEVTKRPEHREFDIYVKVDGSQVLWKTLSGVPVVVEYNIDFD